MRTISFVPGSFAGPLSAHELETIQNFVRLDVPDFTFDPDYLLFTTEFHGGKPIDKYFTTESGSLFPVDYFLNFQARNGDHFDWLNVNVVWSAINDRLSPELVPFATTPGGDFLCFESTNAAKPRVVLWSHERSEEDSPYTEFVAGTFSQFIASLQSKPMPD